MPSDKLPEDEIPNEKELGELEISSMHPFERFLLKYFVVERDLRDEEFRNLSNERDNDLVNNLVKLGSRCFIFLILIKEVLNNGIR